MPPWCGQHRSTRTEYWTWVLSLFVPIFVLAMFIAIIDVVLDTSFSSLFGFVGIAAFALSLAPTPSDPIRTVRELGLGLGHWGSLHG